MPTNYYSGHAVASEYMEMAVYELYFLKNIALLK